MPCGPPVMDLPAGLPGSEPSGQMRCPGAIPEDSCGKPPSKGTARRLASPTESADCSDRAPSVHPSWTRVSVAITRPWFTHHGHEPTVAIARPRSTRRRPSQPGRPGVSRPGRSDGLRRPREPPAASHLTTDGWEALFGREAPMKVGTPPSF